MPKTFRYRLFKIGALPEKLRAEIQNDNVIFLEEGIPVTVHRNGTAPGFIGGSIGKFSGAFAVTNQRIVANISGTVMVDASYDAKDTNGAELSLTEDGLHITVDASIHPRCTGKIQMHFKQDFSKEELARFPYQKIIFQFSVDLIPKIFGVPG
jgi:hypothetical protein